MTGPIPELGDRATACAQALEAASRVRVVSHIDADGLTSGAIASKMLRQADIAHEVQFEKQLDATAIEQIAADDPETVLFTDFGSGQLTEMQPLTDDESCTPIVVDHHQPAAGSIEYHLNPLLENIDGARELSGAGAVYVLARAMLGQKAKDLADLAVVGAVGDRQLTDGELIGANATIAQEGVEAGVLEMETDLAFYGKQTRPLPRLLAYASDVPIPGITGDRDGAARFLDGVELTLQENGEWYRWVDLNHEEKQTLTSALVQHAISRGVPADRIDQLVGTAYTLSRESPGTVLRDATEYSTLLNATARYERADVGLAVCLGDRGDAFMQAQELLTNHRRNLSEGVEWVETNGVATEQHCQWFHAEDNIRETIVGIVAGMVVGVDGVDRSQPIIAFARKDDSTVKVSARATPRLTRQGVDLSEAMHTAATEVGGEGGGHTVAAGASIPAGTEQEFIDRVDTVLGKQRQQAKPDASD